MMASSLETMDSLEKIDTPLQLKGVDHTARPTWKLRETVEFYRDKLGLTLVHVVSARGWGPEDHPDFLHFFFDSGQDSTIAFFYYLGTDRPERYEPEFNHFYNATHTAWQVDTQEELVAWKERLEARGVPVSPYTRHELLESIYFMDPNGYPIEITRRLRDLVALDAKDAKLTLDAAMALEDEKFAQSALIETIDDVWRKKATLVERYLDEAS